MKYLSVCSGIEAATVAWHPLGFEPVAFCEIEAFPSAVVAHHYPTVPNYGDFTRLIDAAHAVHAAGVDLLVGGTPCQAFSVAGLRRGLADPRGGLTLEFVRLAQALRPRWIVWENVPGVLSQDGGRAFGAFLGALGELGYGWAYRVLDAQWFGVAQRRRRVFVVACAGADSGRAAAVLFEPESVRRDPPTRGEAGQRPAPTLAARTRGGGGLGTDFDLDGGLVASGTGPDGGVIVAPPLTATNDPSRSPQSAEVTAQVHAVLQAQTIAHVDVVGTLSDGAHNGGGLNGQDAYTGRILPVVPYDLFQVTAPINRQNRDTTSPCHTLARDNAAHAAVVQPIAFHPTQDPIFSTDGSTHCMGIGTKSGHASIGVMQSMAVRRLTPRECERLQGFPDDYTQIPWKKKPADECPDGPRYKALGNSMAVPVMRWIGERIAKVEKV